MRGAQVCGETGRKVWPPMSEEGAEALAGTILAIIGLAIRFFRPDRRLIPPSKEERKQLGGALREMALRRASWMGAFDDLLAVAFGLSRYTMRALREPDAPQLRADNGA